MTSPCTRLDFLRAAAGGALFAALPQRTRAAVRVGPSPDDAVRRKAFDLIVSGGRLIDPAAGIDGPRDLGITGGRVVEVAARLSTTEASRTLDARGRIVTPGLIDSHVHVFDGVAHIGVPPSAVGLAKGVTTLVDGGSAGATTFAGFRAYVIEPARTRVLALLNIASPGMTVPNELADLAWVDPDAAVRTIEEHRDVIVGIKVRMLRGIPGGGDIEVLRRTREAAEAADVPIVMHIGGQASPLSRLLDLLRPGDVVTHAFRARGSILQENGRVDPSVRAAMDRGVHLDIGHGRGNLDFDVAEAALAQGFSPTTISSDVHRGNVAGPVFGLPTTLSKFLRMGMSLPAVVHAATAAPASIFGLESGSLAVGSRADLSIFDLVAGEFVFEDSGGKQRTAGQRLVPVSALLRGREEGSLTG